MPVTEQDLELLESFLDGAMEIEDSALLQARLASEPELAASMESLRIQRRMRRDFFASLEPAASDADVLTARIRSSIHRRRRFAGLVRSLRYVAAAAACIAIGFFIRTAMERPVPGTHIVTNGGNDVNVHAVASYEVTLRDQSGRVVAVQRFDTMEKAQEFAADLARWQARQEKLASGHFVVTADKF